MSLPRYERYKDSAVEWLGEVPEHWAVIPLKRLADFINGDAFKPTEWAESGIPIIRIQNLNGGEEFNFYDGEVEPRYLVHDGDLLFGWSGNRGTSFGPFLWKRKEVCALNQHIFRVVPISASKQVLYWTLKAVTAHVEDQAHGIIGMVHITKGDLGAINVPIPPEQEHRKLAAFLDQETAKIDALIEEQRRLIDLLKEKRQAVISHAVARIPSSQPGETDAPTAISRNRLRHHVVRIDQGWSPVAADRDPEPGEWAVLKLSAVKRGEFDETKIKALPPEAEILDRLQLKDGDFLITRANTPDLVGDSCYVSNPPPRLIFSDLIYRIVLTEDTMSGEFLNLVLQSAIGRGQARRDARGSSQSMVKLGHEHILNWLVPAPSLEEQKAIVKAVKEQLKELNRVGEVCQQSISLLEERRSALISAAVTGKIDVRAYMAKPALSTTQYSSGFAHQLLAAEILDRCNSQRMGRIKLQKLIHLCEYHAQMSEVQGDYSRKAAGPFDAKAMAGISKNLKKQKWFEEVKEGERYVYRPLEKRGGHKKYLAHWQAEMPRIDEVLSLLGSFKTRECEIVSTLYAAWNDLLIDGGSTDDAAILHEASSAERWHKSKEQIAPERWTKALQWMKDKGLVPVGYGKHTRHTAGQIGATTKEAHEPA